MEDNKRNNQNPYNNPLLQALLDVKRLLWDEGLDLDNIDDIIAEFQDKSNNDLRMSRKIFFTIRRTGNFRIVRAHTMSEHWRSNSKKR